MSSAHDWDCPTCVDAGRRGGCAPLRCYCGHAACHAVESYVTPGTFSVATPSAKSRAAQAWANREESTWLDNL